MSAPEYEIKPWDNPKRFLCIKPDGSAYLVELDHFAKGKHACWCRHYECNFAANTTPCKHIRMVLDHLKGADETKRRLAA